MSSSTDLGSFTIVVPFRNRDEHLKTFVPHMEAYLKGLSLRIVVIEQADELPFNRGALLNAGFLEGRNGLSHVCFHDIDMLPEGNPTDYQPWPQTTHLAGRVEQFGFELPYQEYLGGVFISPVSEFQTVNGFSNQYWGWGGEDNDLYGRFHLASLPISRRPGRYRSLPHERASVSVSNSFRLMGMLAATETVRRSPADQERFEYLKRKYQTDFGAESWIPYDFQSDGIGNLRYDIVRRRRLREAFLFGTRIEDVHELISISLKR